MSKKITELSKCVLRDPEEVRIAPSSTVADNLAQSVFFVEASQKQDLLKRTLRGIKGTRVLVFTRTKHRANRLADQLSRANVAAQAIHSNKSQGARRRILADFDSGKINVLVATDVVARGIDVKEISHVINFELPDDPENYVHRIGRTARAKQRGAAYSFCSSEEVGTLQLIERMTRKKLAVESDHPHHSERGELRYSTEQEPMKPPRRQRGRRVGVQTRGSRRFSSEKHGKPGSKRPGSKNRRRRQRA